MLRRSLVSVAILPALAPAAPTQAAGFVSSYIVERSGSTGPRKAVRDRVQDAGARASSVPREEDAAIIDVVFGMGAPIGAPALVASDAPGARLPGTRADARHFFAAAGRAETMAREGVIVSRGYRPGTGAAADFCPTDPAALDALAEDLVPAPIQVRLR
jgi:hypothetical protein